jgi:hypothetical protein
VGGGYDTSGVSEAADVVVIRNGPNGNDAWTVEAISTGESFSITAWAICVRVN